MYCVWKWGATSWSLKVFFRQYPSIQTCFEVENLGFRMVFRRCLLFLKKHTTNKNNSKNPTRGQASTINWVLLGRLSEGTRHQATYSGIIMLRVTGNLTMPWMDMNGIYMYCMYHIIPYHTIPTYLHTIFYHPSNTVPRCRYDRFVVVIWDPKHDLSWRLGGKSFCHTWLLLQLFSNS